MFAAQHFIAVDRCILWVKGARVLMGFYRGFSIISYRGDRVTIILGAIAGRIIFRLLGFLSKLLSQCWGIIEA